MQPLPLALLCESVGAPCHVCRVREGTGRELRTAIAQAYDVGGVVDFSCPRALPWLDRELERPPSRRLSDEEAAALGIERQHPWTVRDRSRGLGDTVAKVTHALRIDGIADRAARALGFRSCGCTERQGWLNRKVPYRKRG